jgi:hypothetical protein
MKKNTILKKLEHYEDKISTSIEDLRDFLDSTEDPELSSMGDILCESLIEFLHENSDCNINSIREFVTNELEQ